MHLGNSRFIILKKSVCKKFEKNLQIRTMSPSAFRLLELEGKLLPEPLLTENDINSRLRLFPIHDDEAYEYYSQARDLYWVPAEVSLSVDVGQWKKVLLPAERHFLEHTFAFFAASDAIINENIAMNFSHEVKCPEARLFYYIQVAVEGIHSEMYGLLLETLIPDEERKLELFNAVNKIPTVAKKAEWAMKWMHSENSSFAERLVAYAIVEGIFFSGSFCAIYWMAARDNLPGVSKSNEFIAKDEGLHSEFACFLYSKRLVNKLPIDVVHSILLEAVEIETEFICGALPENLEGMNKDLMTTYIQFCANRIAGQLGVPKVFSNAYNPFPFMDKINLRGKTNFFENRVADYSMATAKSIVTDYDNEDF